MKGIIIVLIAALFVVIVVGCSSKSKQETSMQVSKVKESSPDISGLISELEDMGYYKYINASKVEGVKKESIKAGYIFGWEESGRDFSSDAENLAEGGVSEFLKSIKGFLKSQNIETNISDEDFSEKGYKIKVNGHSYEIYSEKELESGDIWELSTTRSFSIVNKLLKEAGSKERIYILYGGNDLRAVFLTEEMYQTIKGSSVISLKEQPRSVPDEVD